MIGDSALGRISRKMIRRVALAERRPRPARYSRVRSDRNSPRTRRATGGQLTIAIAGDDRVRSRAAGSRPARSASAKLGMVWKNSVKRISGVVDHAAVIAGQRAERRRRRSTRDQRRDQADQQRDARAIHDAGSDVAAERVGAERQVASVEGWQERRAAPCARAECGNSSGAEHRDRRSTRTGSTSPTTAAAVAAAKRFPELAHAGATRCAGRPAVDQVGDQVEDEHHGRADEEHAEQQVVVALRAARRRQAADAGPGEHRLDQDRAADQRAGLHAGAA